MKVSELMKVCFSHGLDGKQTDICVRSVAVNLLKQELPVVPIEMTEFSDLLRMMKVADDVHIFIEGNTFHFNALYAISDDFPAPRIYFIKIQDLMQVGNLGAYLDKRGITLRPVNHKSFSQLIDDNHYISRYKQWRNRWDANQKPFKGLLEGRIQNTVVDQGIWLSSNGNCLVCDAKTDRMATVSVIGDAGIMIGLQLCQQHENEAQESSILEYISRKMGVPQSFLDGAKVTVYIDEVIAIMHDAICNKLQCVIEKNEKNTITGVRESGFKIIFRQENLRNYAYNIQDPNGKLISRIDSAAHHDINYGPDHIHRDLSKSKKKIVEPSFTYGLVFADFKIIKQLVEDAELQWRKKLVN